MRSWRDRSTFLYLVLFASFLGGCASGGRDEDATAALVLTQRVEHIDVPAREPMVVERPDGTLFVAGYGSPHPTLWKSIDRGTNWRSVDVGRNAVGNSDVDLAVARDGTLYFISMLYDRTVNEGRQISVGVSTNGGVNWLWTTLSSHRFDDRPWIDVAPDGVVHVIWNDGEGVWHVLSRDRGLTWKKTGRVHDHGGSSHLAVGPRGEVAVRITPASASGRKFDPGVDLIAVSSDDGATWQKHAAPGDREWLPPDVDDPAATPRWVEPLAWDEAGRLYSLWTGKAGVQLARSNDRGVTWSSWSVTKPAVQSFYPYLIARGRGQLAATWFTASSPDFHDLQWHLARIDVPGGEALLRVLETKPQSMESARPRRPGEAAFKDPGGEYLAIAALRDGSLGVATPIQNKPAQRMGFTWWRFTAQ